MGACLCKSSTPSGDNNNGDPMHADAPAVDSNIPEPSASSQPPGSPQPQPETSGSPELQPQPQPMEQQEPQPVPFRSIPVPLLAPWPSISMFTVFGEDDPSNILGKPLEDVSTHFTMGEELGRGRFGVTYVCRERATGLRYACKSISKRKLRDLSDRNDIRREVYLMQQLSVHPNVVEFLGAYEDENSVHLVTELCVGGDMLERIIDEECYSESAAAGFFRSIIALVETCHSLELILRDLKPENFLLTTKTESDAKLKMIGFGRSAFLEEGNACRGIVGSPYYTAPEVIKTMGINGKEADVWSAGVILYILLGGSPPFSAPNEKGITDAVMWGDIDFQTAPWPSISDDAKDLIRKMLTRDPKKRITAAQVLEHSWTRECGKNGTSFHEYLDMRLVLPKMKQFTVINKLKKLAVKVVAENLSEEEIEELNQTFTQRDAMKIGTITYGELILAMAALGPKLSVPEMRQLMEAAEVEGIQEGNASLDYSEFIIAATHRHRLERAEYSSSKAECSSSKAECSNSKAECSSSSRAECSSSRAEPSSIRREPSSSIIREPSSIIIREPSSSIIREPSSIRREPSSLRRESSMRSEDDYGFNSSCSLI